MKTYRVLKAFQDYVPGAIAEFDEDEAKGLLLGGLIEEVVEDEAARGFRKAAEEQASRIAAEAAETAARKVMRQNAAHLKGIKIAVGETADEKLAKTGGFKHFGHFLSDIHKAGPDGRGASKTLVEWHRAVAEGKVAGHMAENDDPQGGYLVPEEFKAELDKHSLEDSIVKSRARVIPMQTNRIAVPAINDTSHASSVYGGIVIYKPAEAAQKTASKPALRQIALTLHKMVGYVYVSDELMEDSPISVASLLNEVFPEAISFYADDDYLNGTGAGEPLGAINAANPSLIAQAAEPAQAANTIVAENIINMWSRLYPRGQKNAVWLANNDCFPQLATMSLAVGAGGVPVYMPANGLAGTPWPTLMGRPLILTEKCQTLGTQGDIALCDFSQYWIGQKAGGGIKAATSMHLRFDYDEVAFRFVLRHDGQPSWNSDLTPMYSAVTVSPFVVLADR